MTVWFWDPSFHTEDNWGTHMQLLQKIQTLTDTPEGKNIHSLFEFEDQGKLNLICLLENMYLSSVASEGQ